MIVYEYKCSSCKAKFQKIVSPVKSSKIICPSCGSTANKKLGAVVLETGLRKCKAGCGNCKKCVVK